MDSLTKAVAAKKATLKGTKVGKNKYLRRGELKKLAEAPWGHATKDSDQASASQPPVAPPTPASGAAASPSSRAGAGAGVGAGAGSGGAGASPTAAASKRSGVKRGTSAGAADGDELDYGEAETVKRLRKLGQPITLFGEDQRKRMARLRKLEETSHDDLALGGGHDIGNAFLKQDKEKLARYDSDDEDEAHGGDAASRRRKRAKHETETLLTFLEKAKTKKYSKETFIMKFFKQLLHEWEAELASRPEDVKRTAAGRAETATQKQCKDYLAPFFRMCKKKTVDPSILEHTLRIVNFMAEREYLKASDQYIQLAIGNAPWPIGVTSVGIHERAARTKIFANNVAHVMNDELLRKAITSFKRLLTVCQRRYPTDPSRAFNP